VKWTASSYGSAVGYSLSQTKAYAPRLISPSNFLGIDQSTQAGQTTAGELSFAMWALFDPNAYNSISGSVLTPKTTSPLQSRITAFSAVIRM
jgi:hypothetical protein